MSAPDYVAPVAELKALAYTLDIWGCWTLNGWDCPACGYDHRTDMGLGITETCEDCGKEVTIR